MVEGETDIAHQPEFGLFADVVRIRVFDENLKFDIGTVFGEVQLFDLPDTDFTVVDRTSDMQVARIGRTQMVAIPAVVITIDIGFIQTGIVFFDLCVGIFFRIHLNVSSGKERVQTADPSGAHFRLDDPKLGLFVQKGFGFLVHPHRNDHPFSRSVQSYLLDDTDRDISVFDITLVCLQTTIFFEANLYLRSQLRKILIRKPERNQQRHYRHDPDRCQQTQFALSALFGFMNFHSYSSSSSFPRKIIRVSKL